MYENEEIMMDVEDEAEYMAQQVGCDLELADKWLEAEKEYLTIQGILISPDDFNSEEEFMKHIEESGREPKTLDCDDMVAHIISRTGMSKELAYDLLDAEYEYEYQLGIAGDITI